MFAHGCSAGAIERSRRVKGDELRKFWWLVKNRGLTPEQQTEFSDYYHQEKESGRFGGRRDATQEEIEELLDEFLTDP